jgi:hypothetical protein
MLYRDTPSSRTARGEKLNSERVEHLEALPGWQWSAQEAAWEDGYAVVSAVVARAGTARAIQSDDLEGGYQLGKWVVKHRVLAKRGQLAADRVEHLEQIPGWTWSKQQAAWDDGYEALLAYTNREGSAARLAHGHIENGYKLGAWVTMQRSKARAAKLKPDRVRRLEAVPGWTWGASQTTNGGSSPAIKH